jgi:hypothetical protein
VSWVGWVAVIWGGSIVLLFAGYLGYRAGLFIGHGRGFHEAMKLASRLEDKENEDGF